MVGVESSHADSEFVHVGFADENGAGGAQSGHGGRVFPLGAGFTQKRCARGGGVAHLVDLVLYCDRNTIENGKGSSLFPASSRGFGLGPGVVFFDANKDAKRRSVALALLGDAKESFYDRKRIAALGLIRAMKVGDGGKPKGACVGRGVRLGDRIEVERRPLVVVKLPGQWRLRRGWQRGGGGSKLREPEVLQHLGSNSGAHARFFHHRGERLQRRALHAGEVD